MAISITVAWVACGRLMQDAGRVQDQTCLGLEKFQFVKYSQRLIGIYQFSMIK